MKYKRFPYQRLTNQLGKQMKGVQGLLMSVLRMQSFSKISVQNDNCTHFAEELHEYVTSINDITGQKLDEIECLWDYLKGKRIIISKAICNLFTSCFETLFHFNDKRENVQDLAHQCSSEDLFDV